MNYLSSLIFRRAFTQSFTEAIASEVKSIGIIDRHWSSYSINVILAQLENFQSDAPGDKVAIRRLPQVEFLVRERPIFKREFEPTTFPIFNWDAIPLCMKFLFENKKAAIS